MVIVIFGILWIIISNFYVFPIYLFYRFQVISRLKDPYHSIFCNPLKKVSITNIFDLFKEFLLINNHKNNLLRTLPKWELTAYDVVHFWFSNTGDSSPSEGLWEVEITVFWCRYGRTPQSLISNSVVCWPISSPLRTFLLSVSVSSWLNFSTHIRGEFRDGRTIWRLCVFSGVRRVTFSFVSDLSVDGNTLSWRGPLQTLKRRDNWIVRVSSPERLSFLE